MHLASKVYLNKGATMGGEGKVRKNANNFGGKTWNFQEELHLQKGRKKKETAVHVTASEQEFARNKLLKINSSC